MEIANDVDIESQKNRKRVREEKEEEAACAALSVDDAASTLPASKRAKAESVRVLFLDFDLPNNVPYDCWVVVNRKEDYEPGSTVLSVFPTHLSVLSRFECVKEVLAEELIEKPESFFPMDLVPEEFRSEGNHAATQLDLSMFSCNEFAWKRVMHATYDSVCQCSHMTLYEKVFDDHYASFALADALGIKFARMLNASVRVPPDFHSTLSEDKWNVMKYCDCERLIWFLGLGIWKNAKATHLPMMRLYATLQHKFRTPRNSVWDMYMNNIRDSRLRDCLLPDGVIDSNHYKRGSHAFSEILTMLFMSMMHGYNHGSWDGLIPSFYWYNPRMGSDMDNLVKFYLTKYPWQTWPKNPLPGSTPLELILEMEKQAHLFCGLPTHQYTPMPYERPILKFGLQALGVPFDEDEIDQGTDLKVFDDLRYHPGLRECVTAICHKASSTDRSTTDSDSWPDFMDVKAIGFHNKDCWTLVYEQYSFMFRPYKL